MGRYFGTDGFRGEANCSLTADHAYKIGRFLGWYYGELKRQNGIDEMPKVVIGKDTRRSSYMFEYALVGGLVASGADACDHHSVGCLCDPDGRLRLRDHDLRQPQSLL